LDERLRAGSPEIRAGWLARALLQEAAASARLDGVFIDPHDLLLLEQEALGRVVEQDTRRAHQTLQLLRAISRRHPRQLLTPRRLLAAARLRLRDRRDIDGYPEWLESRRTDPSEVRFVLDKALDPAELASLRQLPGLAGAAGFLALWHSSGAAEVLGGAIGRALTGVWLRREGATGHGCFLASVGFLGYAADYRPDRLQSWAVAFMEAAERSAEWGLALLARLQRFERRLGDALTMQRTRSHVPALLGLLVSSPAVSPRGLAEAAGITPMSARRFLDRLVARNLVREITGREAFRLYAEA